MVNPWAEPGLGRGGERPRGQSVSRAGPRPPSGARSGRRVPGLRIRQASAGRPMARQTGIRHRLTGVAPVAGKTGPQGTARQHPGRWMQRAYYLL